MVATAGEFFFPLPLTVELGHVSLWGNVINYCFPVNITKVADWICTVIGYVLKTGICSEFLNANMYTDESILVFSAA